MQPFIVLTARLLFSPFKEHRRKKTTTQDLFCLPSHVALTRLETFSSHAHGARCRTDSKSLLLWWGSRRFIVLSLEGNPALVLVMNSAMTVCVYTLQVLAALLFYSFLIYYYFRCLCLVSDPLVYLGCLFFIFFGWHKELIYLHRACRWTAGWQMIPGLNLSVYFIQDLLSTVPLLCWCNFLKPGLQSVL